MVARPKNIDFWRPQVAKASNYGLRSKEILELLNRVNGQQHQITLLVFYLFI